MKRPDTGPGLMRKSLDLWRRLEETALIAMLVAIAALVFFEVLVRNLDLPVEMRGVEEISLILLVWLTLLGAAVCQRNSSHLKVDLFVRLLPPAVRVVVQVLVNLGIAVFLVLVVKGSIPLMEQASIARTDVLEWPAIIWPLAVFVGMGLSAVYFFTGHLAGLVDWMLGRGKWKR